MSIHAMDGVGSTTAIGVLALIISYVAYVLYERVQLRARREAFKLKHGCQPPTAIRPGLDPFGVIFTYQVVQAARRHELLSWLHDSLGRYGRTVTASTLRATDIISNDAENFKCVLSTNFDDWEVKSIRQEGVKWLLGDGIFTTDGAFWAHSRAMLRPSFEKSQVADLSQFEHHVSALLQNMPTNDETVDLQELFHMFTMDTSAELLFGESTGSLRAHKGGEAVRFAEAFEHGMADAVSRSRLSWAYYLIPHPKAQKAIRFCRRFVDDYVERAMKAKTEPPGKKDDKSKFVFLEELAKHEEVDAPRIRNEVLNMLLAGRDTTAALLSNLWFALARHPQIWRRLQAEVDELNGDIPTYERLRDMKYIKCCVQETLRLMPPVPVLGKRAVRDTVLPHGGGKDGLQPLFVTRGDDFVYDMYSMMRQPAVYGADAESFRPDRWADSSLRPGWNFLPFGGGPRVCLGQQYALTECYYVTIRLMQHFRNIEDRDGAPWREKLHVTCCSLNGTKVALTP